MKKKIYQYELGILLDKDDEEYESYCNVWDKKHGYYNDEMGVELTFEEAKEYAEYYVDKNGENAYGIISELEINDEEYEEIEKIIEENGYCETSDFDFNFDLENVIYSLCKEKENFINK